MAKFKISRNLKATWGGIFYQNSEEDYPDLNDLVTADLEVTTRKELEEVIALCEELLKPGYTDEEREELWYAAGADWGFDAEGLLNVAAFMHDEWSRELKRRFS
ncbi:MAG: hypothetical protein AAGC95_10305 [Pseudomonadota bacterium]